MRLWADGCHVYGSLDADVVGAADVPGVSAPNLSGLPGRKVLACARAAGYSAVVTSFDVVEINPRYDRDSQSARWAAVVIWNFLIGLGQRPTSQPRGRLAGGRWREPVEESPLEEVDTGTAEQAGSLSP